MRSLQGITCLGFVLLELIFYRLGLFEREIKSAASGIFLSLLLLSSCFLSAAGIPEFIFSGGFIGEEGS